MTNVMKGLVWMCILLCLGACEEPTEVEPRGPKKFNTPQLKISSFNIRFDNPQDGPNNWQNRKEQVVAYLQAENSEIIGMQEVLNGQFEYLSAQLTTYSSYGIGRDDGLTAGEYAPIYFKTDRFNLLDSATIWLSETPDQPSRGWDAVINRVCTYLSLEDLETGEIIDVYNTHYDHVGTVAQLRSSELITELIATQSADHRVLLTGDMNVEPGSSPYNVLENSRLQDSFDSPIKFGPLGTFNGFTVGGVYNRRIDYVFHSEGFFPAVYETVDKTADSNYLSDHFPVVTLLEYRPL
jgi:endonuclease/exonuclease/phosphatase family metal-dependent hydrolase